MERPYFKQPSENVPALGDVVCALSTQRIWPPGNRLLSCTESGSAEKA